MELTEDCGGRPQEAASITQFAKGYRTLAKATHYCLDLPGKPIAWKELKPLFDDAQAAAARGFEEKVEDVQRKVKALELYFIELLVERT